MTILLPKFGSKSGFSVSILLSIVKYLNKSVSKVSKGGILQM